MEGAVGADDVSAGGGIVGSGVGDGEADGRTSRPADDRGTRANANPRVRTDAVSALALTVAERKAYRMGVLAAGAIFVDALDGECACRERVENLRIAIAGRSVECEAPEFWPTRGGE